MAANYHKSKTVNTAGTQKANIIRPATNPIKNSFIIYPL